MLAVRGFLGVLCRGFTAVAQSRTAEDQLLAAVTEARIHDSLAAISARAAEAMHELQHLSAVYLALVVRPKR